MPNAFALLILAAWPVVTVILFREMSQRRALLASLIAGFLLLPGPQAAFDLPLIPPLNKTNLPALISLVCLLYINPEDNRRLLPDGWIAKTLVLTYIFVPFATAATNNAPVLWGRIELPPVSYKDALGLSMQQFFTILPMLLARLHLATGGAIRDLMVALVIAALAYLPLMLIEVPFGPVLHSAIYGFQQSLPFQAIRGDTFRPVVFLEHGLWVAFFLLTATAAAWSLWRATETGRTRYFLTAMALSVMLVLIKSFGALLMMILLLPVLLIRGRRLQVYAAVAIGLFCILYPMLKSAGYIPQERILGQIAQLSEERAFSLEFRLDNESMLLERALEKPIFGWGSWARNHIIDPVSGNLLTVTDGRWVIALGVFGLVGFLAEFGLLMLPILLLIRAGITRRPDAFDPLAVTLCLLLAVNIFDLIPNATLTPVTWMIVGALLGYAEGVRTRDVDWRNRPLEWKPVL
ncbi:hypothetical protein FIU97_17620 [Roseivivax sp. THAF40]|uniref:hypothetical protein n=1 Tax=unclassified Roseivivax TaxID=2639302 RepID=UPI001267E4E9|nr:MULTISPECIES: hypothetical protein [unclassified Roseivivax]QFS84581.1 hypothetical protein FIV09_17210 [Roseivivax sp. THAF197b]QFT48408.1 hypothetical protein FIU97_17620 [Roseivivax sp. THAF40]